MGFNLGGKPLNSGRTSLNSSGGGGGGFTLGGGPLAKSGPLPAPATPSGGGVFGAIKRIGEDVAHPLQAAGHYAAQQGADVGTGLYGIGTGLYGMGKSEGQTLYNDARGRNTKLNTAEWSDLLHGHIGRMFGEASKLKGPTSPEAQVAANVKATTVGFIPQVKQVIEHPQRNLFQTTLTALPLIGGAAGVAGRVGDASTLARGGASAADVARAAIKGTEPGVRTLRIPGNKLVAPLTAEGERAIGPEAKVVTSTPIQLNSGRSYLSRYGAKAHDVVAQRSLDKLAATGKSTPLARYALARGAKSLEEESNRTANVRDVASHLLQHAKVESSLTPAESSLATVLHAGNVLPEEMANAWRRGVAEGVVRVPQADGTIASAKVTPTDRARMTAAAQIADSLAAKGALRIGATGDVEVNGDLFPKLAAREARVQQASNTRESAIQATNPRVSAAGLQGRQNLVARVAGVNMPERPEEVPPTTGILKQRARVKHLQTLHDRALAKFPEGSFGKEVRASSTATVPVNRLMTPEERASAIEAIRNDPANRATYGGPGARGELTTAALAQIRAIREGRITLPTGATREVTTPSAVLTLPGGARAERIGAALSVAEDRLQAMEAARARKVDLVASGGASGRQGKAFVSLKPYEKEGALSRFARSNKGSISQTKGIALGQHATGIGLALGHLPADAAAEVAGGLRTADRVRNTNDLRGAVAAHGHAVRMTPDDWLVANDLPTRVKALPDEMKVLLGKLRDTSLSPEQEHAIAGKWNDWVQSHLVNREATQQVGERAPAGWTWVHKSLVPDALKTNAQSRSEVAKQAAKLSTLVTGATVYFKPGHMPQRFVTNAAFNAIHGSLTLPQILRTKSMLDALSKDDRMRLAAATGTHGFESLPMEGVSKIARATRWGAGQYAKFIDSFFRQNAAVYELRRIGYDTPAKIHQALDAVEHKAKLPANELMKIHGAFSRTLRAAGDYETNALEKRYIQRFLWFYGWDKAATRFAGHTLIEHPGKSALLGVLGAQGNKEALGVLGPQPSYEGLTPISAGGQFPLTLNLSSLIPTGTVASEAEAVQHPLGSDGVQSFLNPVYAGLQAVMQGKGAKGFASQALGPTPELQALSALEAPHKTGGSALLPTSTKNLFGRTWESELARALGGAALTPRRVNKAKLNEYAAREHQKKRTITLYTP